jgi:hypothetical protein
MCLGCEAIEREWHETQEQRALNEHAEALSQPTEQAKSGADIATPQST